jgi:dTDP-4-dehydrorhamnose 3,5-epimerase
MEIKEYKELPGVRSLDLNILPDERGHFSELLRLDWKELFQDDQILQVNTSFTYPGIIRAWHRHSRGQVDYFYVVDGALKICVYDDREKSPATRGKLLEIVASSKKPQIVRIPGNYWHGIKNIYSRPTTLIYFVNKLYDYNDPDEERRDWNDPAILDPETEISYDWNDSPNK